MTRVAHTRRRDPARRLRFAGLHIFNPVTRTKLVELIFDTSPRALLACSLVGVGIDVPKIAGAVLAHIARLCEM
jgi:hypothetical protein